MKALVVAALLVAGTAYANEKGHQHGTPGTTTPTATTTTPTTKTPGATTTKSTMTPEQAKAACEADWKGKNPTPTDIETCISKKTTKQM